MADPVQGDQLSGKLDNGSAPVKVGGRFNVTPPVLTDGQRGDLQLDASGRVLVGGVATAQAQTFNGTTWDNTRGNTEVGAANRPTDTFGFTSADLTNFNARGLKLIIDITAISGTTPSLTVLLQGKDGALSSKYFTLISSAALTAVGTTVLTVYPGLTAAANSVANDILPRTWRVVCTLGGTTPTVSYTVGASLIV